MLFNGNETFAWAEFGFNIGAGVKTLPGVYAEFIYHIVSRKADWEGAESMGANNWGIHVGYQLDLGI